jgi:hypothetical protein
MTEDASGALHAGPHHMCASPLREPSTLSSEPPPMPCNSSNLTNAQTSSATPDMAWIKRNLL